MATTVRAPARTGRVPAWERPVRLTALHREHVGHGAELVERDGWLMPLSYGDAEGEAAALREGVGLLDIGHGGKIDVKSGDLDALLGAVFPRIGRVEVGTTARAASDGATRVYRLTGEEALLLTPPASLQGTLENLDRAASSVACTSVIDLTSALCGVRLLGPNAPAVLERLCSLDMAPDRFADGALAQSAVARVHAIIARHDVAGATGYDLYVDRDLGRYLWDSLLDQGAPLGIRPVGLGS